MSQDKLNKYKTYYENGLWSIERLDTLVEKGKISTDEYTYITGKVYGE